MKRQLPILIALITATALVGCNASTSSDTAADSAATNSDITLSDVDTVRAWAAAEAESDAGNNPHEQSSGVPPVADMIAGLEQRLEANPDDVKGWSLLATSYAYVGQMSDARRAKTKAVELGADAEQLERQIVDAHDGPQY